MTVEGFVFVMDSCTGSGAIFGETSRRVGRLEFCLVCVVAVNRARRACGERQRIAGAGGQLGQSRAVSGALIYAVGGDGSWSTLSTFPVTVCQINFSVDGMQRYRASWAARHACLFAACNILVCTRYPSDFCNKTKTLIHFI